MFAPDGFMPFYDFEAKYIWPRAAELCALRKIEVAEASAVGPMWDNSWPKAPLLDSLIESTVSNFLVERALSTPAAPLFVANQTGALMRVARGFFKMYPASAPNPFRWIDDWESSDALLEVLRISREQLAGPIWLNRGYVLTLPNDGLPLEPYAAPFEGWAVCLKDADEAKHKDALQEAITWYEGWPDITDIYRNALGPADRLTQAEALRGAPPLRAREIYISMYIEAGYKRPDSTAAQIINEIAKRNGLKGEELPKDPRASLRDWEKEADRRRVDVPGMEKGGGNQ